jgi:hypothetical protein
LKVRFLGSEVGGGVEGEWKGAMVLGKRIEVESGGRWEEISRRATTHPGRRVGVYGRIIFGALLLVRDTIFSEI